MSESTRTVPFFALTYAITGCACLPAVLSRFGVVSTPIERFLPLLGIGLLGPLLSALALSALENGRAGVRALFQPLFRWQARWYWYLSSPLLLGALLALGMGVYNLFAEPEPWFYPPREGPAWMALVVAPVAEEIGWRAFAYPRLARRHGPLRASIILGVLWAFWHTGMFLIVGVPALAWSVMLPFFIAGSIVFTWLYERPGGGVPLVILAHAGAHLSNSHQALPGSSVPTLVQTAALSLLALVLVVWRHRSQRPLRP